jgi:DNA topoisomerase-1
MGKALVIVESPAKIKTLKKFLGPDYIFESSIGHIRDLPQKEFGIDIEHDFEPKYVTMPDKKEVIKKLQDTAKLVDIVYLSPDPDREGEAIAWHISEILPPKTKFKRVAFQSITKAAVEEALANPRNIDMDLVNAQQARRLLDRIVGYKISPILTRRVKRGKGGTSAGRVQSVALKLVVDREKERDAFKKVEYWTLKAELESKNGERPFSAHLYSVDGLKIEKETGDKPAFLISDKKTADSLLDRLKKAKYHVEHVEKKEKRRNPVPPFITSTLQQEASRHYGFAVSRTMSIAQDLYEGIDLGEFGAEGLITYMRTDSVNIAPEAITAVRGYIKEKFKSDGTGESYLPDQPRFYTSKKSAQEAHEGIRPTSLAREPDKIKKYLSIDQDKIYRLIWQRFVASQMTSAIYDTVSADIETDQNVLLRASGSIIKFKGYLAAYEEKNDNTGAEEENDSDKILPPLEVGMQLVLSPKRNLVENPNAKQSFTMPPPRFTEASLIKELERLGIGRPSTYVSIMNKIQSRDYTTKEANTLIPTELGKVICEMLEQNFAPIMDVHFTANMEDQLEQIAEHNRDWKELIRTFWQDFIPLVDKAEIDAVVPKVLTDRDCPKCNHKLHKIWARNSYFYGCSNYPECDFTASVEGLDFNQDDYAAETDWNAHCPICASTMSIRHGRFGAFFGCTHYPDCKGIINIAKKGDKVYAFEDLTPCPAIGCTGRLTPRKFFNKSFFSCSEYPACDCIADSPEKVLAKYPNHPKTPYVKKAKKGRFGKKGVKEEAPEKTTKAKGKAAPKKSVKAKSAPKSNQPGHALTPELSAIVGASEMSRPEVTKALWVYIKAHSLQDAKDKRMIVPDAALAKVIGNKPVSMMKLAGLLTPHFKK